MPPHPETNFEIQKYYQNEPKFNGVCSRNNLPKIKDGVCVINLDEFKSIGNNWIVLHFKGYLCYKTIASRNVSSEVHVKIFLFHRKVMFRFQGMQVLTIPWFTKSVMLRRVLVHETGCIFELSFEPQHIKSPNLASW